MRQVKHKNDKYETMLAEQQKMFDILERIENQIDTFGKTVAPEDQRPPTIKPASSLFIESMLDTKFKIISIEEELEELEEQLKNEDYMQKQVYF